MGWIEWKSGGDGNHFWFFIIISLSRALMNSPKYIPKNNKKNEIRNFYHHFFFFFIHHLLSIAAVHNIIVVPFGKENRFSKYIQWVKQLRLINNHTRHTISSSSFSALLSSVVFILAFRIERRSEVAVVSHNNLIFIARHFNQLWNASDGMKICVT